LLVKNKNLKTETFTNITKKNTEIQYLKAAQLKAIVEEFPYFQAARTLYLKELKSQDSFKYNHELKITAAYTSDRNVLFNDIISFNGRHQEVLEENPAITDGGDVLNKVEENLEVGKPLPFSSTEHHSFNQWLQLSPKKVILRSEEKPIHQTVKKEDLIDKFIQNSPKIKPLEKGIKFTVPVSKNKYDAALMTETLAKVYLEQKKYENAMQAYRILSLKYPEKSGFFADQIKRIQILQKNK
jgi:hypothetical protein